MRGVVLVRAGRAEPSHSAAIVASADSDAMRAAEATVRAFFAVKGQAEDPLSVQIDEQAAYLTARDVHPTSAYQASTSDQPSGIATTEVSVELSNTRMIGDEVLVDFAFESYMMIGTELQLDAGQPHESHWDGSATLEERDGEWLINDLTVDSYGGSIS